MNDFTLHLIHDELDKTALEILKRGLNLQTKDPYFLANYHPDHSTESRNLFYLLKNGKYSAGGYYVISKDQNYVASAGWYPFEDGIIALSRAYISQDYRNQPVLGDFILPKILVEADRRGKKVWMTFNEENKKIYEGFKRTQYSRAPILGQQWPETFRKFKPVGQKLINNFNQYVVEYTPDEIQS